MIQVSKQPRPYRATQTALLTLALLLVSSCGYRPLIANAELGSAIEIRLLENISTEPGVEKLVAEALVEEFLRRGALKPRYQSGGADLVLEGRIRRVSAGHVAFSSVALALEDEIELVLDVTVLRPSTGEVLWARSGWSRAETFTTSGDPNVYESNKLQALRRISAGVANRIHDELLQSF